MGIISEVLGIRGSRKFCERVSTFVNVYSGLGQKGSNYHYKRVIISPPAKGHLMAFRWHADNGPTLNASLVA